MIGACSATPADYSARRTEPESGVSVYGVGQIGPAALEGTTEAAVLADRAFRDLRQHLIDAIRAERARRKPV